MNSKINISISKLKPIIFMAAKLLWKDDDKCLFKSSSIGLFCLFNESNTFRKL